MHMAEKVTKSIEAFFDSTINDRERACFEAGIKVGALFHSILGLPVQNDGDVVNKIQEGIVASFKAQPFVKDLKLRINVDNGKKFKKRNEFDYTIIKDFMIELDLHLQYKRVQLDAEIRWMPELEYPLMYIKKIA